MSKEDLINFVLMQKDNLSNPGTQPTVDAIKQKAQDLVDKLEIVPYFLSITP